jgi:hypothetical protein
MGVKKISITDIRCVYFFNVRLVKKAHRKNGVLNFL